MRSPSSSGFQNQLQQQYTSSQQQLAQQQASYVANQQAANNAAAQSVTDQTNQLTTSVNAATQAPVNLATMLTSPRGLLGNPTLSFSKLGG